MITVTMSMEEYEALKKEEAERRAIRKIARDILESHTKDDWSDVSDLKEPLSFEETQLLLSSILK